MFFSMEIMLAIFAVFFAGFFRGFSGFGAGMVLVPSLSLLYSPMVAVVTVALLEIIPVIQLLPSAISKCHWRSVVPMSVAAMVTIPFGSLFLVYADADTMREFISILVILCVLILATGWRYKGACSSRTSTITGVLSGLISGATGLGGLPVILYYLSSKNSTQVARSSIVVFLVVTAIISLATFLVHGIVTTDILGRAVWLAPVFVVAIWLGGHLFGKVSESLFRAVTLTVLGSVGLVMLLLS